MADNLSPEEAVSALNEVHDELQASSELTPEQKQKVSDIVNKYKLSFTPPEDVRTFAQQTLDYGLRGADYLGGLARGGIESIGNVAMGNPEGAEPAMAAFKGRAPSFAQWADTSGITQKAVDLGEEYGKKAQEAGYPGVASALRNPDFVKGVVNTAGIVGDVATDPLMYTGIGPIEAGLRALNEADKLKAINWAAKLGPRSVGEAIYKIPFKKAELAAEYMGRGAGGAAEGLPDVGQELFKEGKVGGFKDLKKAVEEKAGEAITSASKKIEAVRNVPSEVGGLEHFNKIEKEVLAHPAIAGDANKLAQAKQELSTLKKGILPEYTALEDTLNGLSKDIASNQERAGLLQKSLAEYKPMFEGPKPLRKALKEDAKSIGKWEELKQGYKDSTKELEQLTKDTAEKQAKWSDVSKQLNEASKQKLTKGALSDMSTAQQNIAKESKSYVTPVKAIDTPKSTVYGEAAKLSRQARDKAIPEIVKDKKMIAATLNMEPELYKGAASALNPGELSVGALKGIGGGGFWSLPLVNMTTPNVATRLGQFVGGPKANVWSLMGRATRGEVPRYLSTHSIEEQRKYRDEQPKPWENK